MKIRKAVITAAGKNQRTLPLQTLVDRDGRTKSALSIIIEEARQAGVEEIGVVISPDDEAAYRLYYPICAIVALQLQAGLDGFLAIEKDLLVKRGVFPSDLRRRPYAWDLDAETAAEVDRLFARLQEALK